MWEETWEGTKVESLDFRKTGTEACLMWEKRQVPSIGSPRKVRSRKARSRKARSRKARSRKVRPYRCYEVTESNLKRVEWTLALAGLQRKERPEAPSLVPEVSAVLALSK